MAEQSYKQQVSLLLSVLPEVAKESCFALHGVCKLLISRHGMQIKVEVNTIMRGTLPTPVKRLLCAKAQDDFDAFCSINVLPLGQLYGGKICAALDRQHPRDLFDVKYLLEAEGFTDEIKTGFLLCLLSSDRPISEMLNPNLSDQRQTLENNFDGMATEPFTYDDFEATRTQRVLPPILRTLQRSL